MEHYADLEIALHRYGAGIFSVDFRFNLPDSEAEIRLSQSKIILAHFDFNALTKLEIASHDYGTELTQELFHDPDLKLIFAQSISSSQMLALPLRLRLFIGPSASELHALHWELLQDPVKGYDLSNKETVYFSRYLSSQDWRPIRLRPKGDLRALAVISSPEDADVYGLSPINKSAELHKVRAGLGNITVDSLPTDQHTRNRATLNNLILQLQEGQYDILYLVCHGRMIHGNPKLVLENDQGFVEIVNGDSLVERLDGLKYRPSLVVLVSCESVGQQDTFLASLGPRLAEFGIPAVIAMQGSITFETASRMMPVFFQELQKDGFIDRALAVARSVVNDRYDRWMPVLFMRLKNGQIWEIPADKKPFASDNVSEIGMDVRVQASERGVAAGRNISGQVITGDISGSVTITNPGKQKKE
jgi:hypothetical protein